MYPATQAQLEHAAQTLCQKTRQEKLRDETNPLQ
jgi:hypothetical protein